MSRMKQETGKGRLSSLAKASFIKMKTRNESSSISRREIYSKLFLTYSKQHESENDIKPRHTPPQTYSSSILAESSESRCFWAYSCSIRLSAFLLILILRLLARSLPLLLASRWALSSLLTARTCSSSCRASRFSLRRRMLSLRADITSQSLDPAASCLRQASNPSSISQAVRLWVSYLILWTSMLILQGGPPERTQGGLCYFRIKKQCQRRSGGDGGRILILMVKLTLWMTFDRKQIKFESKNLNDFLYVYYSPMVINHAPNAIPAMVLQQKIFLNIIDDEL